MKWHFVFVVLTLIGITDLAGQSSLIERINFKTEFERKVLSDVDNQDDIHLLLAISENASEEYVQKIRSAIDIFKGELDNRKFDKKSEEKKLKLLFELTHKNFFQKYRDVSNFAEIFNTKEYNCVSATALYALILKEFDIPFSIKEAPTHVYTIAYPQTKGIILESTAPVNGYFSPSEKDIQKAVNSLVELKYYTIEEVDFMGVRAAYNKFFFSEDVIDLRKLAGLQYYNETLTYLKAEQYEEALNANYKFEVLYPSEKSGFLSLVILANILKEADFKTIKDISYLTEYANLLAVDRNEVINSYKAIINNTLFSESDVGLTDSMYYCLSGGLKDSILVKDISEIYYSSVGRFYAQKSDFNKSLEYVSKAYELNNKNANTQSMITHIVVENFSRRAGRLGIITEMDSCGEQFPFLKESILFQSMYFFAYSYHAYNYFRADDIKKGREYLSLMESLIEKFDGTLTYDENQYGLVYAEGGAAYFRKRQYNDAKKFLEKGLKVMPDHPELKVRLQIVIDEMN